MPFHIVRDNIVHMDVDAIVNAANPSLRAGGGVCGAIFAAAGMHELQKACDAIGVCPTGHSVITPGFRLPARWIIHTAGPIWQDGAHSEPDELHACYSSSLNLALKHGLSSIAFPLISSGIYGYPKDQALSVAVRAIGEFLLDHDMSVYLVVYDQAAYRISSERFAQVESYIDEHYVEKRIRFESSRSLEADMAMYQPMAAPRAILTDAVSHLSDTFSQYVLRTIDERGEKDSDVYKRANLDRKLFSKLRSDENYQPSRQTALALAVALCLDMDEARDLLSRAGYAFSPSRKSDVIVSYFIETKNYNIFELNETLFAFGEACL